MADSDPYSRHYWRLVDDPKFLEVYGDDHHYATWSRLLMIADQAWPATAHIPGTARKPSVSKLAAVGLIDLLPGGRFRMHGTDAERRKRSQQASNAAAVRWHGDSNAAADAPSMPSKAKQSIEQQSRAEQDAPDAAAMLYQRTGSFPSPKVLRWLNDLAESHGEVRLAEKINATEQGDRNLRDYLAFIQDTLRAEDHAAERAELADEKRRNEEKRKPIKMLPTPIEITPEDADRIAREYMAEFGRQPA